MIAEHDKKNQKPKKSLERSVVRGILGTFRTFAEQYMEEFN